MYSVDKTALEVRELSGTALHGWRMVQWLSAGTALQRTGLRLLAPLMSVPYSPRSFQLHGDAKLLVSPVLIYTYPQIYLFIIKNKVNLFKNVQMFSVLYFLLP